MVVISRLNGGVLDIFRSKMVEYNKFNFNQKIN